VKGLIGLLVVGGGIGAAVWWGLERYRSRETDAVKSAEAAAEADPRVRVARPRLPPESSTFLLPATLEAFQAIDVFARVDGYVLKWFVDIGARVKAGTILLEIDTPELDQQLRQAEADLAQSRTNVEQAKADVEKARADEASARADLARAEANLDLAVKNLASTRQFRAQGAATQLELDQRTAEEGAARGQVGAAKANVESKATAVEAARAIVATRESAVRSQEANVKRLRELQSFRTVTSPFDGVVTRRVADIGSLVTAQSGIGNRPLFSLAQAGVLRVRVYVPQTYAAGIRIGQEAPVLLREFPGQAFPAKVARTAGAIDVASRTLLTELDLPNPDGRFLPGSYAQVRFTGKRAEGVVLISANTLVVRPDGTAVAVVDGGNRVQLRKIQIGRDLGADVEVIGGLTVDDRIVVNPPADIQDGRRVEVAEGGS
jgi:RND family efflux transporter MFP subunit